MSDGMDDLKQAAERALACLDLTNLNDDCTASDVRELCRRAQTPFGPTAAVCVWPRFVHEAASALRATPIRIATVVNFPGGDHPASDVMDLTEQAIRDGADEIDMVIPWKALIEGHPENIPARVARVKGAAGTAPVKAIIESGMLGAAELITEATRGAIDGGANFVKTSTGKVPVNATPQAAETILTAIAASESAVGFKASGGVRTTADAAEYLALADRIMGKDWATPERFRFGASGVLSALLATLRGQDAPAAGDGY